MFCLSGADGQVREGGAQGLHSGDVRVLSRAEVRVDGVEPEPVAHGARGASDDYTIGLLRDLGEPDADPAVWLRRDRSVVADGMTETFSLVNRSDRDLVVSVELAIATDMAPIEAIKAGKRGSAVEPAADGLSWTQSDVAVTLDAAGAAVARSGSGVTLRWPLAVPARSADSRSWSLSVKDRAAVVAPAMRGLDRTLRVTADDPRLARLLARALDDLDALLLCEAEHPDDVFVGAGAPWYLTLFGRDALWAATLLLPVDVLVAAGTLRTLARSQGRAVDSATGEEPGKILHERRRSVTAHRHGGSGIVLPPRYYGTIDATPLWICLLRDAWRWGLPAPDVEPLLPHLEAALGWIDRFADRDGDGFIEYHDDSGCGLTNQGWKDSTDAMRFADGAIAAGPVALVEVQGYVHEAALAGAELLVAFGRAGAPRWRRYAAGLAARFRDRFWVSDAAGAFPALALDGAKMPLDTLTSNAGHLLGTGLLDPTESERVGARLLGPELASGYGLRTMSKRAGGYSPLSYHCGSVWPHDTAIVLRGLARAGQQDRAARLGGDLLAAADAFDQRLPELFAGLGSDEVAAPVPHPAACRPQAWAAAAAVAVLQAVLGLSVDVPAGAVTLRPPTPSPVGAVSVRGLAVGGGRLDVDLDRDGGVLHIAAPAGLRVTVGGG